MAFVCRNLRLVSAACTFAVLLVLSPAAHACSCAFRELCDSIDFADVVLRGDIIRRTELADAVDATYNVKVITLFKVEGGVDYPEEIVITTSASSAACGIYPDIGEEYLLDLIRTEDGELRSVGLCGAIQSWTSLDDEKLATLDDIDGSCGSSTPAPTAAGDGTASPTAPEDPCEGQCGEFYECLFYSGDVADDQYYCSASCDLNPCEEGEECTLVPASCAAGSICGNGYSCTANATITVEEDPCDGTCNEFQECLFYSGDIADDQYYCSASCDLDPCEEGEECTLVPASCAAGSICGNGYVCSDAAAEDDPCEGSCNEFQECLFYSGDVADDQYYCSASCDLDPCEEGEECTLVPASCAAGSICGNGYVCSATSTEETSTEEAGTDDDDEPCTSCSEFQECTAYDNDGVEEFYCGDTCDPSPCEDDETCSLVDQSDCDEGLPACPPVSSCNSSTIPAETDDETQAEDPSSALRVAVGSSTLAFVVVATLLLQL